MIEQLMLYMLYELCLYAQEDMIVSLNFIKQYPNQHYAAALFRYKYEFALKSCDHYDSSA